MTEFLYDQQEEKKSKPKKLPFGCLKGKLTMTEDFDEPLSEFEKSQLRSTNKMVLLDTHTMLCG